MKIFVKIFIFIIRFKNTKNVSTYKEHNSYIKFYNVVRNRKGKGGRNSNHSFLLTFMIIFYNKIIIYNIIL